MSTRKFSDTEIERTEVEQRLTRYTLDGLRTEKAALEQQRDAMALRLQRVEALIAEAVALGLMTETERLAAAATAEAERMAALPADLAEPIPTWEGR